MKRQDLENNIFIGIVEDNIDPKRLGRIKVRVMNVYDNIPTEDIPFASPWKDLNGNTFILPDKGKIVSVVFDRGNKYKPEYIYAEHYNKNLEEKLNSLSDSDYKSMRALIFDHKTQIYSNDKDGLKIDYKYNNINILDNDINVNIKDNFGHINLGSPTSNQQGILGNNWLNWFDEFVDNLLGSKAGPYLDSSGAPVVINPSFVEVLSKYKVLKDPKFLSHHVNLVDNEYVDKQDRITNSQIGDSWKSTVHKNEMVNEKIDYKSKDGISSDVPSGELSTYMDSVSDTKIINPQSGNSITPPITPSNNPDVDRILSLMSSKNYVILNRPYEVNIVGIRRQYEGMKYSNSFMDDLYVIYKTDSSNMWNINKFKISTMPGFYVGTETGNKFIPDYSGKSKVNIKQSKMMLNRGGIGILMEAQYLKIYTIGSHLGSPAMITTGPQKFYRDSSPGNTIKYTNSGSAWAGMFIHKGFPGGSAIYNWSEGCQIFSSESELNKFFEICNNHKNKYGNSFNYTLMLDKEL